MKKKLLCLLLCLLLIPIGLKNAGGDGKTRCLLIGCDRFVSMPGTEPASANNVDTMAALLTDFLPKGATVQQQVNGPGTIGGFEELIADTFRDANTADTAVIYLSTHGILKEDESGRQWVELLLSDGTDEEGLGPERLRQILDGIPGEKVLILDACHSGAMIGCGEGANINWFENDACRVLVSSGADEESWFWSADKDAYTGTGYFTSAMNNALRASDLSQIDPNGSGNVSLEELTARLRGIHGASTVYCWPEKSRMPLFSLPKDRKPGNRLRGLYFDPIKADDDTAPVELKIHFNIEESTWLMYRTVPSNNGEWDFEHSVKRKDPEKKNLIRGLLEPDGKPRNRTFSIPRGNLGTDGIGLFQVVSLHGDERTPVVEAEIVISYEKPETEVQDSEATDKT